MAGELPSGVNTAGAAMLAGATLHSLAVRARAGAARADLVRLADTAAAALVPPDYKRL